MTDIIAYIFVGILFLVIGVLFLFAISLIGAVIHKVFPQTKISEEKLKNIPETPHYILDDPLNVSGVCIAPNSDWMED